MPTLAVSTVLSRIVRIVGLALAVLALLLGVAVGPGWFEAVFPRSQQFYLMIAVLPQCDRVTSPCCRRCRQCS